MENYTVTLPHYSAGPEAYEEIGRIAKFYGRRVAVIGGEKALLKAGPALRRAIEHAGLEVLDWQVYGQNATQAALDRITTNARVLEADIIFGVGGGRAIDTVKTAADILGKPCFTFPTVASNCAPVSAIAVIYKDDGTLDHYHFMQRCPEHCFINTTVILDSPESLFWAGIGDALSKQMESELASRGKHLSHTPLLGVQVGSICEAPLLEMGKAALEDFREKKLTDAFLECVLDIIVSTGIVSNLTMKLGSGGYYYNSSLAHLFYNAVMAQPSGVIPKAHDHLHGEVVSFGNLVLLAADGRDEALVRMMDFNKSIGLPVKLADLDITTDAQVEAILDKCPSINEWKCVPYEMTRARYRDAILKVDAMGRAL